MVATSRMDAGTTRSCRWMSRAGVRVVRRPSTSPFARAARRSLSGSWRWIAPGNERRTAYGSRRGLCPLHGWNRIPSAISRPVGGAVGPRTFDWHDGSRDTVESSHGRGPLPGLRGGTDTRLYRIGLRPGPFYHVNRVALHDTYNFCMSVGGPDALGSLIHTVPRSRAVIPSSVILTEHVPNSCILSRLWRIASRMHVDCADGPSGDRPRPGSAH